MMYSEFATATGCKDNAHNHKLFNNLEVMYMNTDMSKEEIYEIGRAMMDNSKSEEELRLEAELRAEIDDLKEEIKRLKNDIDFYKGMGDYYKEIGDKDNAAVQRRMIANRKDDIRTIKRRIAEIRWILGEGNL